MKTIILPSALKTAISALIVFTISLSLQQVFAQTAVLTTTMSAAEKEHTATAKSALSFQSAAFPINQTGKVQVIFKDPTGNGASIIIRDNHRNIIHNKTYKNSALHISNIDLSPLPDGAYTVEVISLNKAGFNKEKYSYNFQIQSTTTRSFKSADPEQEKGHFNPRQYQVKR